MKRPLDAIVKQFLFDTFKLMAENGEEIEARRTIIRYLEIGAFSSDDIAELSKMLDEVRKSVPVVTLPDEE